MRVDFPYAIYRDKKRLFVKWSEVDKTDLKHLAYLIRKQSGSLLRKSCCHIKGHGGLKGVVRSIFYKKECMTFYARFDIQSYYESIDHAILLKILRSTTVSSQVLDSVEEFLNVAWPYAKKKRGIVAGASPSPLLGALYLSPLDCAMEALQENGSIFYIRFMDDFVILTKKRWQLRKAIKIMYSILSDLKLRLHPKKQGIGKVKKGFSFLGYTFQSKKKLKASKKAVDRFKERFRRLYEQGVGTILLWHYVTRWNSYQHAGLLDLVSKKGGILTYYFQALKSCRAEGFLKPFSMLFY